MSKDQKSGSLPEPMPAPQLPNIPISPDDPFQFDPEQLPPVMAPHEPGPAPSPQPPGRSRGPAPGCDDPPDWGEREDPEMA
jgi:hypothetical protein